MTLFTLPTLSHHAPLTTPVPPSSCRTGPRRGGDIQIPMTLSFMEAVNGATKTVRAPVEVPCDTCAGTGSADKSKPTVCTACKGTGQQVMQDGFFTVSAACNRCGGEGTITKNPCRPCGGAGTVRQVKNVEVVVPPGVDSGISMRLPNQGSAGEKGGAAGHIYVSINVEADPFFTREEADIHVTVPVRLSAVVLGATVTVPTIRGEVELKVPPGTQPTDKLVLRGRGVRRLNGGPPGNQYVHLKVLVPKHLTPKMAEAMKAYSAAEEGEAGGPPDDNVKKETGFFTEAMERIRKALGAQAAAAAAAGSTGSSSGGST